MEMIVPIHKSFEIVERFKYLGVLPKEDSSHQICLQEIIKILTKHALWCKHFVKIKTSKKLKFRLKNTIIDKMLTYAL
jgi:hypothetical protein